MTKVLEASKNYCDPTLTIAMHTNGSEVMLGRTFSSSADLPSSQNGLSLVYSGAQ